MKKFQKPHSRQDDFFIMNTLLVLAVGQNSSKGYWW